MDFVTRQFIVLAKKLRKELRTSLDKLHGDLQQSVKSQHASEEREKQQDNARDAELRFNRAINRRHRAYEKQQYRLTKTQNRVQVWIAVGTWLTFFAALFYGGITAYQAFLLRETLEQNNRTNILGIGQLAISARSARIAEEALTESRLSSTSQQRLLQIEQRPLVVMKCCEFADILSHLVPNVQPAPVPSVGRPFGTDINVINTGKSSALNFSAHYHVVFGNNIGTIRNDPPDGLRVKGLVLSPGIDQFVTANTVHDTFTQGGPMIDPKNLLPWDGTMPIVVFGRFTYEDRFGNKYCTPFTQEWLATGVWADISNSKLRHPDGTMTEFPSMCPFGFKP